MAFPRIVALLFTALGGACSVGQVGGADDDVGGDAGGGALACVDRLVPADTAHAHEDDGTTKRNQSCIVAGCHLDGAAGAPIYTAAGTVSGIDAARPNPGVTVRVFSNGVPITAITDSDGNFFISQPLGQFPTRTEITACPNTQKMVSNLTGPGDGNCTNGACHGASTGVIIIQ